MKLSKTIIGLIVCLGIVILGLSPAHAQGNGKRLVLNLVGSGYMYKALVDGFTEEAECFDVNLFNAKTGQLVGTATDCFSDRAGVGTGVELIGTTTFNLPQGTLVARGATTVQPVVQPTETTSGDTITHIAEMEHLRDVEVDRIDPYAWKRTKLDPSIIDEVIEEAHPQLFDGLALIMPND